MSTTTDNRGFRLTAQQRKYINSIVQKLDGVKQSKVITLSGQYTTPKILIPWLVDIFNCGYYSMDEKKWLNGLKELKLDKE